MTGNRTSLLWWYPKVAGAVDMPKTIIVPIDPPRDAEELLFREKEADDPPLAAYSTAIMEAGRKVGYPLFIRTDLTSGKHSMACYVEKEPDIFRAVAELVETHGGLLWLNRDSPVSAIVVRPWIELDSPFRAFAGLPISRERRYFVRDGKVVCRHPYWPEEAIQFWGEEPPGWQHQLGIISVQSETEIALLTGMAAKLSRRLPGAWSLDFARTKLGQWLFIDAALAHESWHPECPHAENFRTSGNKEE